MQTKFTVKNRTRALENLFYARKSLSNIIEQFQTNKNLDVLIVDIAQTINNVIEDLGKVEIWADNQIKS